MRSTALGRAGNGYFIKGATGRKLHIPKGVLGPARFGTIVAQQLSGNTRSESALLPPSRAGTWIRS